MQYQNRLYLLEIANIVSRVGTNKFAYTVREMLYIGPILNLYWNSIGPILNLQQRVIKLLDNREKNLVGIEDL